MDQSLQRSGALCLAAGVTTIGKDVYGALCRLVSCDPDDLRTIGLNRSLQGTISSGESSDYYDYQGSAGQRISANMDRTSGNLDPFLSVWDPRGTILAYNNN